MLCYILRKTRSPNHVATTKGASSLYNSDSYQVASIVPPIVTWVPFACNTVTMHIVPASSLCVQQYTRPLNEESINSLDNVSEQSPWRHCVRMQYILVHW